MVRILNNQHVLFVLNSKHTIAGAKQLHGKALSFNNIKDADSALALVKNLKNQLPLQLNT